MSQQTEKGFVTRLQSGFYTVRTDGGEVTCGIRGKMKQEWVNETLVAVGDLVEISLQKDGSGVIEKVLPRKSSFFRMAPSARGEFKQIMLANPDQIVLVFACADPDPSLRMLDRFLVIAEKLEIPALIAANKIDLVGVEKAREIFSTYTDLGYPVVFTSAKKNINIGELEERTAGKLSAFYGPSGAGKSSLLNRVQPGLGLQVGAVKETTGKGKHTTVVRELFELRNGGFVADMPGIRTLSLWDIEPEELDGYFRELRGLVSECQFNDCKHISEPGCAVKEAVAEGKVSPERYESYVRLRMGDEDE